MTTLFTNLDKKFVNITLANQIQKYMLEMIINKLDLFQECDIASVLENSLM